jgi:hypothetical protein
MPSLSVEDTVAAVASGNAPPNVERLLTRPDGTSVWVALLYHMPPARFATPRSLLLGVQVWPVGVSLVLTSDARYR